MVNHIDVPNSWHVCRLGITREGGIGCVMALRTIFNSAKRKSHPVYVRVLGDGRGYDYRYETYDTWERRRWLENMRKEQGKPRAMYNINVYPKR